MDLLAGFTHSVIALFVILSPFSNIPIFLSFTSSMEAKERFGVLRRASVTAFVILLTFALAGQVLFDFFNITMGAFRVAGGILLFMISISMLYGEQSRVKLTLTEKEEAKSQDDVAITPLGIPMMAGPGAIATVISLMGDAPLWSDKGLVIASIPLAVGASWLVIRLGVPLMKLVGVNGLRVMTRLMGLILAVIAVQFVINGLRDALPQVLGS